MTYVGRIYVLTIEYACAVKTMYLALMCSCYGNTFVKAG